jgi:uncharacterized membrane protein (UPF0127 family)
VSEVIARTSGKQAVVEIRSTEGSVVAERVLLAAKPRQRLVGLLGRRGLEPGGGILLRKTGSIHMFFMRFAIDAVFLDRDDTVVKIVPDLKPWRLAAARRAKSVLEIGAGECAARGLAVGDVLQTTPASPEATDA